jgi:sugar-specific transcriptional regulator TrmB
LPDRSVSVGRPPSYCSAPCRRLAEYEIRRLDRRLGRYEDQLREELADRNEASHWVDNLGRTRTQRLNDLRKWIAADESRLRELAGGADG